MNRCDGSVAESATGFVIALRILLPDPVRGSRLAATGSSVHC